MMIGVIDPVLLYAGVVDIRYIYAMKVHNIPTKTEAMLKTGST